VGLAGLLLGAAACADDQPGASGEGSSSSSSSSSTAGGTGSSGPGTTATAADTTAGVVSTGSTTADGTSSSGPASTDGTGSSSSSGGSTTRDGTSSDSGESSSGGPAVCGDGVAQSGEQCDGGDFGGFDCVSLGFGPGLLFCDRPTCTFDTSSCSIPGACGNGVIDPAEQCDGGDLQGFDCEAFGFGGGTLLCDAPTCTFDLSMCSGGGNCGDGMINPGEQCDGANLQGFDCASLGLGGGMLACDPITCTFDTSMCMPPGGGTSG
jgi:hypothetical protein